MPVKSVGVNQGKKQARKEFQMKQWNKYQALESADHQESETEGPNEEELDRMVKYTKENYKICERRPNRRQYMCKAQHEDCADCACENKNKRTVQPAAKPMKPRTRVCVRMRV